MERHAQVEAADVVTRGHLLHHYLWREGDGVQHLFALEETLEVQGEYVLWPR